MDFAEYLTTLLDVNPRQAVLPNEVVEEEMGSSPGVNSSPEEESYSEDLNRTIPSSISTHLLV